MILQRIKLTKSTNMLWLSKQDLGITDENKQTPSHHHVPLKSSSDCYDLHHHSCTYIQSTKSQDFIQPCRNPQLCFTIGYDRILTSLDLMTYITVCFLCINIETYVITSTAQVVYRGKTPFIPSHLLPFSTWPE